MPNIKSPHIVGFFGGMLKRLSFYDARHKQPKKNLHRADVWLAIAILILSLFGILMVYNSSVAIGIRDFQNQYYFAQEQLKWLVLGWISVFVFSRINYHRWYILALPFLAATLIFLLAVFIPGIGVNALGAHRWINFRLFILQPSELAKLTMVIYLSAWFSNKEKGRFVAFLLLMAMVFGLIILEPDLGTGVILLATSILVYFLSGARLSHFVVLIPIGLVGIALLAITAPYRFARITSFLNPDQDPLGSSYQIRQVLIALGSGGITGVGIGKSRQKYEYLPEANTDAIFAIIGEEIGFVGAVTVIMVYFFIVWRGFRIAIRAPDMFGKLLAAGVTSMIGIQTLLNLGAMAAVIPLTGIPLPFISYGGSSLVIVLTAVGILLNISRYRTTYG